MDDAGGGPVGAPLAIATDILLAENANAETRRRLDELRARYSISPDLPLGSQDFEAFASRVLNTDTVAEWSQCKTLCSECQANMGDKQYGIIYRIHGQENELFNITFTYLPERETDPVSVVVTGVTVIGGATQTPAVIKRGASLQRYTGYTQTFKRTGAEADVSIRINLEGRESIRIPVTDKPPEGGLPVGTVIPSILSWEEYAKAAGDTLPYDSGKNYWAPCDGRTIKDARLYERTTRANAPDLRGVFLRGLNQFAPGDESEGLIDAVSDKQRDTGPRDADGLQGDGVGAHEHKFYGGGARGTGNAESGNKIHYVWYGESDPGQSHERDTAKGPTGETRPKNAALHYYIKIN